MVVISQLVNWATSMYSIVNSRGPFEVPGFQEDFYQFKGIIFVVVTLLGGFFIMNLFVGVVINSFNAESNRLGMNFLLTES